MKGQRRKVQRTYFWTPLPRPRLPKRFPCPRSSPPVRMFRVYVCVCVCVDARVDRRLRCEVICTYGEWLCEREREMLV